MLETLVPLISGSRIILANESQQINPYEIKRLIIEQQVKVLQVTPSRLQQLLSDSISECLEDLTTILVGGEALSEQLLCRLKQQTKARIYNVYGPTETTVWSTIKDLTDSKDITIGVPIANTNAFIIDKFHNPLPIGIVGELCIGGDGLARGYIKNSILTEEKFIIAPFSNGERVYRTGDLAKWLPNGEIKYVGRTDHQVKLRGYRIETTEIESALLEYNGIMDAVCVLQDGENEKIVSFVLTLLRIVKSQLNKLETIYTNIYRTI